MLAKTKSFVRALFGRSRMEQEMETELASHIAAYTDDLKRSGVPAEEAERRARAEFGPGPAMKEQCRESRGLRWPFEVGRDLRYAARVLRKSPAFTIAVVVTLALCIGLNTAIFSVVDTQLLRSLPYPNPERLATISTKYKDGTMEEASSVDGFTLELLQASKTLEVSAYSGMGGGVNLLSGTQAEYAHAQRVTAGYFHVLKAQLAAGREFTKDEDRPVGPPVAILSYELWKRLFHGDPSAIGQSISLKGEPYTVVGVVSASFRPPWTTDLWTPLRPSRTGEGEGTNYGVIARLRPDVSWAQADADVKIVGQAGFKNMGLKPDENIMGVVPLQRGFTESIRTPLMVLWAAVIAVLLIGCVNIAGLLLVRGIARAREIGTRMALGSNRSDVVRQLLSETVLLALVGGALGILLGNIGLKVLKMFAGNTLDLSDVSLDGRVLLVSICASVLTGLIFGAVPALQAARVDIRQALVEGGTRGIAGGSHRWMRRALVVGEVALGVILLVVAGLLIRTFLHLHSLDPGFDPHNAVTAQVSLQDARYKTSQSMNRVFDDTLARLRSLPGVQAAGAGLSLPYERPLNMGFLRLDGPHAEKKGHITNLTYVTPGYFEALKFHMLSGRRFTDADKADGLAVAIVNETFARMFLADQNPIGSHLQVSGTPREIVGVVADVEEVASGIGDGNPINHAQDIYIPAAQTNDKFLQLVHTWFSPSWVVRRSAGGEGFAKVIQDVMHSWDPQLPVSSVRTMDDVVAKSIGDQTFQAVLLGGLGAVALLLAAIGVYGLIANSVIERTRELGIRMALGATVGQAMRAIATPGIVLGAIGVALGCLLARGSVGVVRNLLFGVQTTDLIAFLGAAGCLLLASVIASVLPAFRVTRINPADSLRAE